MINIFFKNEIRKSLSAYSTYLLVATFLLVAAYFFFNLLSTYNQALQQQAQLGAIASTEKLTVNTWVLNSYFQTLLFMLILFVVPLSANRISQERSQRTLELLLTLPIHVRSIVVSKFLYAWFLLITCLLFAALPPVCLVFFDNPDIGLLLSGFIGLILAAAAFTAVCIVCSAIFRNVILSNVIALALLLLLYSSHMSAELLPVVWRDVFRFISPLWQLKDSFSGILTLKPLVYFSSIVVVALMVAIDSLDSQRLRS